jgi:hypothetical protein
MIQNVSLLQKTIAWEDFRWIELNAWNANSQRVLMIVFACWRSPWSAAPFLTNQNTHIFITFHFQFNKSIAVCQNSSTHRLLIEYSSQHTSGNWINRGQCCIRWVVCSSPRKPPKGVHYDPAEYSWTQNTQQSERNSLSLVPGKQQQFPIRRTQNRWSRECDRNSSSNLAEEPKLNYCSATLRR